MEKSFIAGQKKVTAIQYTGRNGKTCVKFNGTNPTFYTDSDYFFVWVEWPNEAGYSSIHIGDWIVKDMNGTIVVYPNNVFAQVFKPMSKNRKE